MANWTLKAGDWCHIDLLSGDSARSRKFYGDVFGWEFNPYPGTDIIGITTSEDGIESNIGGLAEEIGAQPPASSGTIPYILAPDMDATLASIERSGGEILVRTTDLLGYGDFARFRDPDGNVIGLWRDKPGG
jgi:uncharacterized protein